MRVEKLPEELGYPPNSGFSLVLEDGDTEEMQFIVQYLIPNWAKLFAEKNKKYAGLEGNELGAKGKFVDIYRKVKVLKSRIWDGHEVVGEDNDEVLFDIIGHAFLAVYDLAREARRGKNVQR